MDRSELAVQLKDVAAGLLTPFNEDDSDEIRFGELASTTEWLYDECLRLFLG